MQWPELLQQVHALRPASDSAMSSADTSRLLSSLDEDHPTARSQVLAASLGRALFCRLTRAKADRLSEALAVLARGLPLASGILRVSFAQLTSWRLGDDVDEPSRQQVVQTVMNLPPPADWAVETSSDLADPAHPAFLLRPLKTILLAELDVWVGAKPGGAFAEAAQAVGACGSQLHKLVAADVSTSSLSTELPGLLERLQLALRTLLGFARTVEQSGRACLQTGPFGCELVATLLTLANSHVLGLFSEPPAKPGSPRHVGVLYPLLSSAGLAACPYACRHVANLSLPVLFTWTNFLQAMTLDNCLALSVHAPRLAACVTAAHAVSRAVQAAAHVALGSELRAHAGAALATLPTIAALPSGQPQVASSTLYYPEGAAAFSALVARELNSGRVQSEAEADDAQAERKRAEIRPGSITKPYELYCALLGEGRVDQAAVLRGTLPLDQRPGRLAEQKQKLVCSPSASAAKTRMYPGAQACIPFLRRLSDAVGDESSSADAQGGCADASTLPLAADTLLAFLQAWLVP
jgi:hypothetical protein